MKRLASMDIPVQNIPFVLIFQYTISSQYGYSGINVFQNMKLFEGEKGNIPVQTSQLVLRYFAKC